MWRYLVPLSLLLVIVVVFYRGLYLDPSYVPSPLIGQPAPQFDLPNLQQPDERLTHAELAQGRPVLVNVWATWCEGCWIEHAKLVEIAESGVIPIYGLNWKDDDRLALDWLRRGGDPYVATGVDTDGRVAIDWGVYGAPETFLIDGQGYVRYKHLGPITTEVWEREFLPRIRDLEG
jgi:cytochrome c biogenesis protein CcmG, thiol:disulfide interchange protein DsbE